MRRDSGYIKIGCNCNLFSNMLFTRMGNMKKFLKKYKWIVIGVALLMLAGGGVAWYMLANQVDKNAMFFESKCLFRNQGKYYSMIVDDYKSARTFARTLEYSDELDDEVVTCAITSHSVATNETLFVYSMMTVLKDAAFAMEEYPVNGDGPYQVQFYGYDDSVVALSCHYKSVHFYCYDKLPDVPECPETSSEAYKLMGDICDIPSNERK